MTTKSIHVTSPSRALRSTLRLSASAAVAGSVLLAAPAIADVPEGWTVADEVQFMDFFMLLVGWPIIATVVIGGLVFLLNLRKSENPYPGIEGDWVGGPRDTKSVAAASAAEGTGGASGSF